MSALAAELDGIDHGNQRLNRCARRILAKLGDKPTMSIPAARGGWSGTRAAYRLFEIRRSAPSACSPRTSPAPRRTCARTLVEVYFKVLKSGCKIEELQLETRARREPALAFYRIMAWRLLYVTMRGRDCPEMHCDAVFAEEEWKAVYLVTQHKPPPKEPPSLDTMVRMITTRGGFLNRKGEGFPGPKILWIGVQRIPDFVLTLKAVRSIGANCGKWYGCGADLSPLGCPRTLAPHY